MYLSKTTTLLAAISLCSALVFALELKVFETTRADPLAQIWAPAVDRPTLPLSLRATHEILRRCEQDLSPPGVLLKTGLALETRAIQCREIIRGIQKSMPTHGHAYFVAALAEHQLGQTQEASSLLGHSANLAPFEGWLAQRRLAFAFENMTVQSHLFVSNDIKVLLTTQSGSELLVRFYILRPEVRSLIAKIVEQAATGHQARFVNLLKKDRAQS